MSPHLLITEATAPNKYEESCKDSGHLTPKLLKEELTVFRELKGYLPRVVLVHMNPEVEEEIRAEIAVVTEELNSPITLGYEGMQFDL